MKTYNLRVGKNDPVLYFVYVKKEKIKLNQFKELVFKK